MRYRLGCTHNSTCTTQLSSLVSTLVGKRQVPPTLSSIPYCGECCTGELCNGDLCPNGLQTGSFFLKDPPPDIICQDYDSVACVALYYQNFCSDHNVRNFLCRRTCGFCSGSIFTQGTTEVTEIATVKPTYGSCYDEAPNCADPTILALVCNIDPKQCSLSCKQCTPNGATANPTTTQASMHVAAVPTQKYICNDPIPECRCQYLDSELGICNDHDAIDPGNIYCCYYCTRKYRPKYYICPSKLCDVLEAAQVERIKQQHINITCASN